MALTDWYLTAEERDNPDTRLDSRHPDGAAWSEGNLARALIHGATYFADLVQRVDAMGPATCCCSPTGVVTRTS